MSASSTGKGTQWVPHHRLTETSGNKSVEKLGGNVIMSQHMKFLMLR